MPRPDPQNTAATNACKPVQTTIARTRHALLLSRANILLAFPFVQPTFLDPAACGDTTQMQSVHTHSTNCGHAELTMLVDIPHSFVGEPRVVRFARVVGRVACRTLSAYGHVRRCRRPSWTWSRYGRLHSSRCPSWPMLSRGDWWPASRCIGI